MHADQHDIRTSRHEAIHETPHVVLLRAMHAGDEDAASHLWKQVSPRLIAYAKALRPAGSDDADDLVQRVFCRTLSMRRAAISEVHDVLAFFVVAVKRAAMDSTRNERRRQGFFANLVGRTRGAANADGLESADLRSGIAVGVQEREDRTQLLGAINGLDDDLQDVVLFKHAAGLTFDQIALALQEPRSTVAAKYQRAIALLRKRLAINEQTPGVSESSPRSDLRREESPREFPERPEVQHVSKAD